MTLLKSLITSRAFWTGLGPAIISVLALFGIELGTDTQRAMYVIITLIAGWLGMTIQRGATGAPTSHTKVMAVLEQQRRTIDALQEMRGVRR